MPIGGGPRGPPPPGFFGGGPPPGPPADPMMRAYGPASGFRAGDEFGRARAGRGERDGRERDYERARERDYERERERARERIRREEREREHGEERRRDRGRSRSEVERERDREGRREEGRGRTRSHSEERPTEDARVRNRSFSHERPQDETRGRNRTRSSSFERSKDENRGRRSMSKDSVKDDNKKKERIQSADRVLEEKKDGHPTEDLDRNEEDRSSLSRRRRSRSEDRSERRGEKRRKSEENGKRRDRAENGDGPDHGGNDHTSDDDKKPSSPRDKSPQQSDSKPKRERRRRESPPPMTREEREAAALTKDRRTVFVSQLVLRATEKDVRRYFRRNVGKVNDVILLKDRRTGRHKGIAYVELGRLEDVSAAVALSNQVPDFQRFPLLVRESEAEKNHAGRVVVPGTEEAAVAALVAIPGVPGTVGRLPSGVVVSSAHLDVQKVYVGSIERAVTPAQLSLIFNQFGTLTNVNLQVDPATGVSRGFAFLSYTCPKVANLAIQTMSGQILAGRALLHACMTRIITVTHGCIYHYRLTRAQEIFFYSRFFSIFAATRLVRPKNGRHLTICDRLSMRGLCF
uniref:RRM domain-containing protein n=1 Tax=Corethron hystrix TaxID=216773 RepID=A0A7S1BFA5_9STRA